MLLIHFYVGECIAQSRDTISSPKSQSFLENVLFVYKGKNQGLLIAHLMLCSRRHLHRHIFGLKYITSQDFNIMYPVRWGGLYLSSVFWLLFAQALKFISAKYKSYTSISICIRIRVVDIPLKTQATGYKTFDFTKISKGYHGWALFFHA